MILVRALAIAILVAACHPNVANVTPCVENKRQTREGFELTNPRDAGFDSRAVSDLLEHARVSRSDAVVVVRDGKLAIEEYFGHTPRPIFAMSASKSISSLAIAILKQDDAKFSLDEPLSATFPAWSADPLKARVTVRHLVTHTSGLSVDRTEWWKGGSVEETLARAQMRHEPGADFRYNNAAVDFLSVFVFAKTKMRLDDLLQREVFGRIGVTGAYWKKDAAGHPMAAGELAIEPLQLVKIGQLMLQDGVWEGRRILPEGWVAEVTRPSQRLNERCGMLWWLDARMSVFLTDELLAIWRATGVASEIIEKVRPLVGVSHPTLAAFDAALIAALTKDENERLRKTLDPLRIETARTKLLGPVRAFAASGWLGQRLVIVPSYKLVAVRMHALVDGDDREEIQEQTSYTGFVQDVRALVGDRE